MNTATKLKMSQEVIDHLTLNASTESFRDLPGNYEKRGERWGMFIDFDKVTESQIKRAETNLRILKERVFDFNKKEGPRVGDYLELPYGLMTRFTHAWDDGIQIGGGSASYYLGDGGYISYSGGLDPSIEYTSIEPTEKVKDGMVWFFNEGYTGGGRGVHFYIPFRVFKLVDGYNTSKIWIVQEKEKEMYRTKAETITRKDGNGNFYTLPLPELIIQNVTEEQIKQIESLSGLNFEPSGYGQYRCQPLKKSELQAVIMFPHFEGTFYNNSMCKNSLYLKFTKKGYSTIPSIF